MVGMNKKKERSQNAVSVKNRLFLCMGCADCSSGCTNISILEISFQEKSQKIIQAHFIQRILTNDFDKDGFGIPQ